MCRSGSTAHPFVHTRLLANVRCNESLVWLLLCYQYWILTGTPLGYPAIALSHGDPQALNLQDQPLYILQQQFIGGEEVWVGQTKALDLGLGSS